MLRDRVLDALTDKLFLYIFGNRMEKQRYNFRLAQLKRIISHHFPIQVAEEELKIGLILFTAERFLAQGKLFYLFLEIRLESFVVGLLPKFGQFIRECRQLFFIVVSQSFRSVPFVQSHKSSILY